MRCQSDVPSLFKENNNEGARGYKFVWVNGTLGRLKGHEQQRALASQRGLAQWHSGSMDEGVLWQHPCLVSYGYIQKMLLELVMDAHAGGFTPWILSTTMVPS